MKSAIAVFCVLMMPAAAAAQDVSVRVFSMRQAQKAVVEFKNGCACEISGEGRMVRNKTGGLSAVVSCCGGKNGDVSITVNGETRHYRGSVSASAEDGKLVIIVKCRIEDYTAAVLASEYDAPDYEEEAAKALCVVIRSYFYENIKRHGAYDVCDSSHCQQFRGFGANRIKWERPAFLTAGMALKAKSRSAFFSSCCGGTLDKPEAVWNGAASPAIRDNKGGADFCAGHRYYRWEKTVLRSEIERTLAKLGVNKRVDSVKVVKKTDAGRAYELAFYGSKGSDIVNAEKFMSAFGKLHHWARIPSRFFDVTEKDGVFIFSGRGQGHGTGLCLAGATEMARQGYSYTEILAHYFPGASPGRYGD